MYLFMVINDTLSYKTELENQDTLIIRTFVIRFWKTDWILTLGLFHFIGQLMATLVHYTYTVPLPDLIDWCGFLEQLLPTLQIYDWDNETHGGRYMESMGLKFTPVIGRRLLYHSSMFGPMDGTSGTHS